MGVCAAGATANDCDASPRDLFVTREGVVYFIEGSEIKRINKEGKIEFVTGKRHLQSESKSAGAYSYRSSLITGFVEFNREFFAVDPIEGIYIGKTQDNEISIERVTLLQVIILVIPFPVMRMVRSLMIEAR